MLIITRTEGEEIVIDGVIRVRVVGIKAGQVKLGVEAPRAIQVDRAEVHERKLKEIADGGTGS